VPRVPSRAGRRESEPELIELCGTCGGSCHCVAVKAEPRWQGAAGRQLDELAAAHGIRRREPVGDVGLESDQSLRARLQLTIILGSPYQSGLVCGELLDKQGARQGVNRGPWECDDDFRVRIILQRFTPEQRSKIAMRLAA